MASLFGCSFDSRFCNLDSSQRNQDRFLLVQIQVQDSIFQIHFLDGNYLSQSTSYIIQFKKAFHY